MIKKTRLWTLACAALVFLTALSPSLEAEESMAALVGRASSLLNRGKYQKALRKYEKAFRIDASAPEVALGLSVAYLMTGDDEKAARYSGKAAELSDTAALLPEDEMTLGWVLFQSYRNRFLRLHETEYPDHREAAARALRRALQADPDRFASARYYLAEILTDLKRRDEALAELDAYMAAVGEPKVIAEARNLRCELTAQKPPTPPEGASIEPPKALGSIPVRFMSPPRPGEGTAAAVQILIDENGDPVCVRTLAGRPLIWALEVAERYRLARFQPARHNGRPVPFYYVLILRSFLEIRIETSRSFALRPLSASYRF